MDSSFTEYLKKVRTALGYKTGKALYDALGGVDCLGFTIRHYHLIESGKSLPDVSFLLALFKILNPEDYKPLLLSFFASHDESFKSGEVLFDYINRNLSPPMRSRQDSIWESSNKVVPYSEEQLLFLANHPQSLRFHKRALIYDSCHVSESNGADLRKLEDLGLIKILGEKAFPSSTLYKVPSFMEHDARSVCASISFIRRHIDTYALKEGSIDQEFSYSMGLVKPDVAEKIMTQLRAFKSWVQSQFSAGTSDDLVPLIFVGFTRKLRKIDL